MVTARRTLLLTGASGRLGTAFCARHADRYDIVAVHRDTPLRGPTQDQRYVDPLHPERELLANRYPVYAVQADLTNDHDVRRVVEIALARLGHVDVLVNAAANSEWGPLLGGRRVLDSLERQFRLNVRLPLLLATELADASWRHESDANHLHGRHVINVSSIAGNRLFLGSGQSVYAASKAALNQLTRHMADEFSAIGVRVNAVAPNSFPRVVGTDYVADCIAELDAGHDSGRVLIIDAVEH
jgi:NAD(P)-dependent dehydrogenase (short-subunit alcohol dehydrogenase family)